MWFFLLIYDKLVVVFYNISANVSVNNKNLLNQSYKSDILCQL